MQNLVGSEIWEIYLLSQFGKKVVMEVSRIREKQLQGDVENIRLSNLIAFPLGVL